MMHQRMDLSKGFQIEEPYVFVPWDTPETQFMDGFEGLHLRLVKHGYFTTHLHFSSRLVSSAGLSL